MRREADKRESNKEALIARARLVAAGLVLMAVLVFIKLLRVQFYDTYKGKTWAEYSMQNDLKLDTIRAMRGNIYSSDGSLLATSLPYFYVGLDTKMADTTYFNANLDRLVALLATHFGEYSAARYRERILEYRHSENRRYLRLKKQAVSYLDREQILKWPFFDKRKGGKFEMIYRRDKPFTPMADRTIGSVSAKTGQGAVGIEASFDQKLVGKNGVGLVEVIENGMKIPVGDDLNIRPEPGYDVYTTLDMNFQDVAEVSLRRALRQFQADHGSVVVMEVATGEIRAISNLSRGSDGDYHDALNYALAEGNDPGSTFKLATLMAVLEETGLDPDQEWCATGDGNHKYRNVVIKDAHRGGFGTITARQVLEKSSNIGTHLLTQKYFAKQPDKYLQYLEKFRLKSRTGIHMQGEAAPYIKDRADKTWSGTTLSYLSYGYEMRLSPIQVLAFYNAVANGGYWVRPMIVKQIKNSEEVVDTYEPYVDPTPICSERTARLAQSMLEGVVQRGTATNLKNDYYRIAGKTGTAQRNINGGYAKDGKFNTSFVGYFPAERPKYSCIVVVSNARGASMEQLYAGSVAAPVFREVANRIYAYDIRLHKPTQEKPSEVVRTVKWAGPASELKAISTALNLAPVPEGSEWMQGTLAPKGKVAWYARSVDKADVPDLRGMALRDALYLMENKGFRVTFKGAGKVVAQSLEPGTKVLEKKSIMLTLE
ncbi:penicillin-binding protein [Rhabdobacter roseus]|uniref:Cell division protein FtsI (Penicillin-binding protein 3) n=1 Tax=Rhabdobacter roseus TaxID=1655419 RepID=A0A840TT15_9BACT|nr:penicillin-binding protein [Rhabdobacter roseus]MBB5287536.1 cell division protein FtsI (penicillin-binding protein 3) [Rhabdobacter roseus]